MPPYEPQVQYSEKFRWNRGKYGVVRPDRGVRRRIHIDDTAEPATTEANFQRKRRRASAATAAAAAPEAAVPVALDAKGRELVEKTKNKIGAKMIQAAMDGALLPEEITDELKMAVEEEGAKRQKRARERENKQHRVAAVRNTKGDDILPLLTGVDVWVDPDIRTQELATTLRERQCTESPGKAAASVYVVADPAEPGQKIAWYALLRGIFVVTPQAFRSKNIVRGVISKCTPAWRTPRSVYFTTGFHDKHENIVKIIRATCPTWSIFDSREAGLSIT